MKEKLLNPSHKTPTYATKGIGILEVMYDEDHLYDHEGSGSIREETECAEEDEFVHLINFNLLVDTEDFSLISKKIGEDKKFNFELNIDIQESSIVKHDKYKSTGITNADIIDYKLLL